MDLAKLVTEERNPGTLDIDMVETVEMLKKINNEDKKVPPAVEKEIPSIAKAIDAIAERLRGDGRLFYIGAGTSGRIGVLDASECPPTYGVDPEMVQGIIAGGDTAIRKSTEGVEDDACQGRADLLNKKLITKDVVVGLAASGRTPYVLGAMEYARSIGVLTVGICCTPENLMKSYADIMIVPVVGPEVITGSTRMKAGTAQKLVLNMISTGVMIKLGKVYSNLMVDVRATNQKLVQRARRIVKQATGAGEDITDRVLKETGFNVKLAIVMILTGLPRDEADRLLEKNKGHVRETLEVI